ncbi:unnamed protein product [Lactuca virosa]|uniref:Uncharacterized protein n=1 Tax=Lactuca virosa TaxID=75947 RepID=A0AAU9N267_9ASTR|nr:unnamed protein product [Lactuca virosa]
MEKDTNPIIHAHYNGTFAPSPLMYFDADIASIPYKVVNNMTFPDFTHFLEKLTNVESEMCIFFPHEEEETNLEDDLVSIDDVDFVLKDGLKT